MPVVDIYNGAIPDMRRQGYTLQAIGDEIGVTRERVRQILSRYYPGTCTQFLKETQVAKVVGCSPATLRKLCRAGKLSPIPRGKHYLYDREEIEKAYLAVLKTCPHCGSIYMEGFKYCRECRVEHTRYYYPFMTEEAKKNASLCSKRWQKNNPERYKVIRDRAVAKWQKQNPKKIKVLTDKYKATHFARTHYRVVYENPVLPMGTVFQAVKGEIGYLLLADGSKIPSCCVRIIG